MSSPGVLKAISKMLNMHTYSETLGIGWIEEHPSIHHAIILGTRGQMPQVAPVNINNTPNNDGLSHSHYI